MLKHPLTLLAALLTLGLATSAAAQDTCIEIQPGQAVGPLRLGMSQAEFDKLKLPVTKNEFDQTLHGPYQVQFTQGELSHVGVDGRLAACLQVKGSAVKLDGRKAQPAELAAQLKDCGPLHANLGGNVIYCKRGISLTQSLAGLELRLDSQSTEPKAICDGYVVPGDPQGSARAVKVQEGKRYCVGTRTLSSTVKPDDLTDLAGELRYNTCRKTQSRGATTVSCDYQGVKFIFAGPTLALDSIEAVPLKQ